MATEFFLTNIFAPGGNGGVVGTEGKGAFIAAGVTVAGGGTGAVGLYGLRDNHRFDLAGYAVGDTGVLIVGNNGSVHIHAGGGAVSSVGAGVRLTGANGMVSNQGTISGATGIEFTQFIQVLNSGHIDAAGDGISGLAGGNIVNHGSITGHVGINLGGLAAVTLTNTGTITGRLSAVSLSDGDDIFVNDGIVAGAVAMGKGNDLVDGSAGRFRGTVYLLDGDDSFEGGAFADRVHGNAGSDDISGGGGNDRFFAYDGDGEDIYDGGAGIDTFDASLSQEAPRIDLSTSSAVINGETDQLIGIENVLGSSLSDWIRGSALSNVLGGGAGADTLSGVDGNDTLYGGDDADVLGGGDGNDRLSGQGGADTLSGGNGDDVLAGGDDIDRMAGGAGADRFDFNDFNEFLAQSAPGRDRITDFVRGQDLIDLSTIDADITAAGNNAFVFVGTAAIDDFGQVGYRFAGGNTIISLGYNSAESYDVLQLDGQVPLTASDFIL